MTAGEIKFRAWLSTLGKMTYPMTLNKMMDFDTAGSSLDSFVWLQYTGLHDKNGVEIYEGDIVTLPYGRGYDCMQAQIVWGFCGWEFRWLDRQTAAIRGNEREPIFHNVTFFEVLGNIYEHPHLLKQEA